jgi:hypothetical protein
MNGNLSHHRVLEVTEATAKSNIQTGVMQPQAEENKKPAED